MEVKLDEPVKSDAPLAISCQFRERMIENAAMAADIMLGPPSGSSQQLVSVMLPTSPTAQPQYCCLPGNTLHLVGSSTSQVPSAEMKDIACNSPAVVAKSPFFSGAPAAQSVPMQGNSPQVLEVLATISEMV